MFSSAEITSAVDVNHDARVNAFDLAACRANYLRSLPLITAPAEAALAASVGALAPPTVRGLAGAVLPAPLEPLHTSAALLAAAGHPPLPGADAAAGSLHASPWFAS
jgi:hypothetical protein